MENSQVFWNLELDIKPGKLNALKTLAGEMTSATRSSEPGALAYVWSVNSDNTSCHIFESYKDSDAARIHLGNFQAYAERFFDCLDISRFQVYGHPDDELKKAMAGLGSVFFDQLDGFTR